MALKKTKVATMFSVSDYEKMANEYNSLSEQIKAMESRKKALAEQLKTGAQNLGVKDDKGSFYLDTDTFVCGSVIKKSMKINLERARALFSKKKLNNLIKEEIVYSVDEDAVEKCVAEGKLTLKEVESITDINTSFSVSVKVKEVISEVEQSNLSVAKRK